MNLPNFEQPILQTKLHRPTSLSAFFVRPALLHKLDRALSVPLTLVSAPAGFGKSTLVAQWLNHRDSNRDTRLPSAWLSLDENDHELTAFITCLAAALRTVSPGACPATAASLQQVVRADDNALIVTLVNEVSALFGDEASGCGDGLVLVLDDYDAAASPQIDAVLNALLRHPPPGIHVILTTRRDPALHISRLRTKGQILEIRSGELRLTPAEIARFFESDGGPRLAQSQIEQLTESTEGWIAGLQLARFMLGEQANAGDVASAVEASSRYAMEYLVDEVLARLPEEMYGSLLCSSIVTRFCAPLVESVCVLEGGGGEAFVRQLQRFNLFLIGLDADGFWFRYHQLFRKVLQNQLVRRVGEVGIAQLHGRAGLWLLHHGFVDEALEHAFASGDSELAIEVLIRVRHDFMNHEQWQTLDSWMQRFDRATIDASPTLLMTEAWLSYSRRIDVARVARNSALATELLETLADDAECHLQMRGEVDVAHCMLSYYACDFAKCLEYGHSAWARVPREHYVVRIHMWMHMAGSLFALGHKQQALDIIVEGRGDDQNRNQPQRSRLISAASFVHWQAADLDAMLAAIDQSAQGSASTGDPETQGWNHHFRACALYERNQLAQAEIEADAVAHDPTLGSSGNATAQSYVILARTQIARGQGAKAQATLEEAAARTFTRESRVLQRLFRAAAVEVALRRGNHAHVLQWLQSEGESAGPLSPAPFYFAPDLALPKALLFVDTPQARQRARIALTRLLDHFSATHNARFLSETLALFALLEDREGNQGEAFSLLRRALDLTKGGGLLRLYADLGPRMAGLLNELGRQGFEPAYIARILDACAAPSVIPSAVESGELAEPLTERETEILALLAGRLTNKEIASRLVISVLTVKRHTINIYTKLHVDNRREAVAKAILLGILPQHAL